MLEITEAAIDEQLRKYFQVSLAEVLAPISETRPCGDYLRYDDVYDRIKEYRRADDPTLPQGIWSHDLKHADWQQVADLTLQALTTRSKDIQLGIWLLEASIHLHGFAGIAPSCLLLAELCKHNWDHIFPEAENGDIEFRINPFVWANKKLVPLLRLVPIAGIDEDSPGFCWADWIKVNSGVKNRDNQNKKDNKVSSADIMAIMSSVATAKLISVDGDLLAALMSIDYLGMQLDTLSSDDAPSLSALSDLLTDIQDFIRGELNQRGVAVADDNVFGTSVVDDATAQQSCARQGETILSTGINADVIGSGRYETYAQLERAAHYLMQVDPHSPAPYLVLQACRWGNMDTRELYRELFVECRGQLNIFELLGVDEGNAATAGESG